MTTSPPNFSKPPKHTPAPTPACNQKQWQDYLENEVAARTVNISRPWGKKKRHLLSRVCIRLTEASMWPFPCALPVLKHLDDACKFLVQSAHLFSLKTNFPCSKPKAELFARVGPDEELKKLTFTSPGTAFGAGLRLRPKTSNWVTNYQRTEKMLFPKKSDQNETLGWDIKNLRLWNKGVKLVPVASCNVFIFPCGKQWFPNTTVFESKNLTEYLFNCCLKRVWLSHITYHPWIQERLNRLFKHSPAYEGRAFNGVTFNPSSI